MIAHFIETRLLPMSDCAIDLHSGGSSLQYCPTIRARANPDPEIMARTLTFLRAFRSLLWLHFQAAGRGEPYDGGGCRALRHPLFVH
jgi:predicted deacylase